MLVIPLKIMVNREQVASSIEVLVLPWDLIHLI